MDFDHVYKAYFKDVFLYLRSLSANADTAEEITQETFESALRSIDTFDGAKDIRAWLFTIAKNKYYTHCKRQKRFTGEAPPEDPPDPRSVFMERIYDQETAFHIHQFLHNMKEPYKEVFTLRVFGELPFDRIALLFGKSASWARVAFYRAKTQIKEYMEGLYDESKL